jgi:KDO2-lipid IV(A) lauroyltransferase
LKNILEYILFISLSFSFRLVGLKTARKFSSLITFIFFYLIPIRKKVTIDNLQHAFPEYFEADIKNLAYKCYKNFCITLIEILYIPWLSRDELKNVLTCPNLDLITKRYEEGNGVILLSAHFSNWEYLAVSVALQINKKLSIIVKSQRNPYVNNWMNKMRTKWTNEVVPLGVSIRNIFSVLMQKGIVAMVADQRGPAESIKLEFFGRMTSVYTGPAVLSLKTNAPLIYGILIRQKDYSYYVEFKEIDRSNLPDDKEEKVKVLSERSLRYMEDIIRKYPEQWLWMHKRWKH